MQTFKLLILPLLFLAELFVAQKGKDEVYQQVIRKYADLQINDPAALPHIHRLIALAKKEKNAALLTTAYHDALHYTPSENLKLQYADSAIATAHRSCKDDLIATAYLGKGIVYYFNFKQYRPALQQYIEAMHYAEKTQDLYLIHKIGYHLGVVKSYLGNNEGAIRHFKYGAAYFLAEMNKKPSPNLLHNVRKGYYNSIRQLVICYQNQQQDEKADSLIRIGEKGIPSHPDFKLVRSYFHESRGISEFRRGNYERSMEELGKALPAIERNGDFAWASVIYFYQGKNQMKLGQQQKAMGFFKKVDSVYRRQNFMFAELCENYNFLMHDAQQQNRINDAMYYADTHRKLENKLAADALFLSTVLHAEAFNYEKGRLAQSKRMLIFGFGAGILLLGVFFYHYYLEKEIEKRYRLIVSPVNGEEDVASNAVVKSHPEKFRLPEEIYNKIKKKMAQFEEDEQFLQAGLTEKKMADQLRTNTHYLSAFINLNKGVNFPTYLSEIRIRYMGKQLAENPEYLKYSTKGLASHCGMGSRATFSKHFMEIYGMSPQEYLKKCRKEREER